MATLPTFPTFARNDSSLAKLQQLSGAVAFACRCPVVFHLAMTADQNIPTGIPTALKWGAAYADSDSGWDGGTRYIAATPGFFDVDAGANCTGSGTAAEFQIAIRVTTGPGNPAGAGNVIYAAARSGQTDASGLQESLGLSCTTPYMYVGDWMEAVVYSPLATTVTASWNTSGNSDLDGNPDGGPWFTGILASLGP